jgi:ABC-2 type transport system ATP-binding protein
MSTTPAIRIAGLMKSYGDLEVLRGVDLDVARGSIFALLGSNGAGKTTVVKILSTLLKADAGTAMVNGFDVATQAADVRESISLTGQFAAVDEILTGHENLVLIAGYGTSTNRTGSPTTCSPASRSPRPGAGGWRPTRAACVAVSTSR